MQTLRAHDGTKGRVKPASHYSPLKTITVVIDRRVCLDVEKIILLRKSINTHDLLKIFLPNEKTQWVETLVETMIAVLKVIAAAAKRLTISVTQLTLISQFWHESCQP